MWPVEPDSQYRVRACGVRKPMSSPGSLCLYSKEKLITCPQIPASSYLLPPPVTALLRAQQALVH